MFKRLKERHYQRAVWLLMLAAMLFVIAAFRDFGVTWDEELQSQYGLAVVDYYVSFFHDHRFEEIFNLYLYGGTFDGFASIFDRFTPFSLYETRHLLNALMGMTGLWGVWRLGRFLGGGAVGFMAVAMLALTPMYIGHMFNNPKDIPFAAGIVWSIYYMARALVAGEKTPRKLIIKLGVVFGLTLGVRVGGIMLFAFWCVALFLPLWQKPRCAMRLLWKLVLPAGVISYLVMLACWPWAQQSPILNPLRALGEFSNFPQDVEVLLDGVTYRSTQLPWFYVPLYFGVQLPEFLLIISGMGLLFIPRLWRELSPPRRKTFALMAAMALLPMIFASLHGSALYDAVRHFLFVVPLLCVFAALAAHHIGHFSIQAFERPTSRRLITAGLTSLAVLVALTQLVIMARLHPYEYIYVNRFAGGVAGAYGHYELDYWASSFKEAAEKLQDYVAKEGGVPPGKIYKVAICGSWSAATIYLPPNYDAAVANEPAEFFLSTTRWLCPKMRPGREVITIERMGAPLAVVKDLRGGYEHYEGNRRP